MDNVLYEEARRIALRLFNRRFLSRKELVERLKKRGYEDNVIEAVVDKMTALHYLDDERLAREVYRRYNGMGKYGNYYIRQRLKMRGLPEPEDCFVDNEREKAWQLIKKRFMDRRELPDKAKVIRFLQYRGFAGDVIHEVLERIEATGELS